MLVKESQEYGKISLGNTKMPGTTYAVDAFACLTGSKLALVKGSICSGQASTEELDFRSMNSIYRCLQYSTWDKIYITVSYIVI